jgi:hypothetical protein
MKILLLLLWLVPIAINIYADKDGDKPNYLQVFILRGFCAILHGALFNPQGWVDYEPILIFQVTSYWLLFEIGLNAVRGRALLYYDTVEKDSGWIDRFFALAGREWHLAAKISAFILMVWSIIVIL